jgi:hypothetical protein
MKALRIVMEILLVVALISLGSNYYRDTQKANEARGRADLVEYNLSAALRAMFLAKYMHELCGNTPIKQKAARETCESEARIRASDEARSIENQTE